MPTTYTLRSPVPTPARHRAHWLEDADFDALTPTTLDEDTTADVAILGGGMTGLWTAYRITEADPRASVVILEAELCGSAASGRNGGQIHSWYESLEQLTTVTGSPEWALRFAQQSADAITEIADMQDSGVLDAGLRLDGWIWTASASAQEEAFDPVLRSCEAAGVSPYRRVDADEIAERTGSRVPYMGIVEERAGTLQPARLCRELRRILINRGVRIYEQSPVTTLTTGDVVTLTTPRARVTAARLLLATNAWAAALPQIARYLYNVESQVLVTEPVPERLDALGWTSGAAICDSQRQVLYYQRTSDGRVQFGRGSGVVVYADRIGARQNYDAGQTPRLLAEFHRIYPTLADVPVARAWTGVVDCNASHLPLCGRLRGASNVVYAVGWNGSGLAQIPAVSHLLASELLDLQDQWWKNPLMDSPRRRAVPPEPLRYVGAQLVRSAVCHVTDREIRGERPGIVSRSLSRLVPTLD